MEHGRSRVTLLGLLLAIFAGLFLATLASACSGKPVGRKCFLGTDGDPDSDTEVVVSSRALDCESRLCLLIPLPGPDHELPPESEHDSLCTDECSSADECERVDNSPCQTGFTCGIATVVGNFCCKRLCMCKDYLILPEDGNVADPKACDPEDEANTCANLPGRS